VGIDISKGDGDKWRHNPFYSFPYSCYHLDAMEAYNRRELFEYYNERAPEFEEFYYGIFPADIPNPEIYRNDRDAIGRLMSPFISGHCVDMACGTGFWLPYYHENCSHITLIDQSDSMLAESRKKIDKLEINDKTTIIQADIFDYQFPEKHYHCANIGFLISHLTDAELNELFRLLKAILLPGGRFTIVDSAWGKYIENRGRQKDSMSTRELFDGRKFEIYKRYFLPNDLQSLARDNNLDISIEYWGRVFFFATGIFNKD